LATPSAKEISRASYLAEDPLRYAVDLFELQRAVVESIPILLMTVNYRAWALSKRGVDASSMKDEWQCGVVCKSVSRKRFIG